MTERGTLDDPQYRWIQRATLLVVPLIQLGANPAAFINPGANVSIDAWVNTGFFLNLPGHLERFGFTYYSTRLSWLVPGFAAHRLLPPVAANYLLHLSLFCVLLGVTYRLLAIGADRHHAMVGALLVAWSPAILAAIGSNYVDGAGIVYLMTTLLCLELAVNGRHAVAWSAAAGAAAACLLITNLALVLLLPACAMFLWRRAGSSRWRWMVGSLAAALGGAAVTLVVFAVVNKSLGGRWLFLEPSIRFAQTMWVSANPWRDPGFQWSGAAWLVMPFCIAVGTVLTLVVDSPAQNSFSRAMHATFLTAVATWVLLDALTHTAVLQYPYYVSYLAPLALISLALQAGDMAALRGWRSALTIELTVAATLAVAHVGFLWYGAGLWARIAALSGLVQPSDRLTVITTVAAAVGVISVVLLRFSIRSVVRGGLVTAGLAFLCAAPYFWQGAGEPDARARFQTVADAYRFIGGHLAGSARFWYRFTPQDAPPLRAIASTYLWGWVLVNEDMPGLTAEQAATLRPDTRLVLLVERRAELDDARAALKRFGWDYSIVTEERFGVDRQACTVVIAALVRAAQAS